MPTITHIDCYFMMVAHPCGKDVRVGPAYRTRKVAVSWRRFVKATWHGLPTWVERCRLRLVDGQLDQPSRKLLDGRFNMEPPAAVAQESA